MQEKESTRVVWCGLKITSLGIIVWHETCRVMPNNDLCDVIFNPHHTIIKDSCIPSGNFSLTDQGKDMASNTGVSRWKERNIKSRKLSKIVIK